MVSPYSQFFLPAPFGCAGSADRCESQVCLEPARIQGLSYCSPIFLAEVALMLWRVIRGANEPVLGAIA